jgi:hypothetical protein
VKKNFRELSPEICHPGISAVCPGARIHFVAPEALVRFASTTLRPSTDKATATLSPVGFDSRRVKLRPRRAST